MTADNPQPPGYIITVDQLYRIVKEKSESMRQYVANEVISPTTPARQPQYIITEDELSRLHRHFIPLTGLLPVVAAERQEFMKQIRSHPHTSPPAPDEQRPEFMNPLRNPDVDLIYEYAAKAAREKEAIRWITALNTLIATESKRKDKESVNMVYSYRVAQIIESLRAQQEQGVSER